MSLFLGPQRGGTPMRQTPTQMSQKVKNTNQQLLFGQTSTQQLNKIEKRVNKSIKKVVFILITHILQQTNQQLTTHTQFTIVMFASCSR